MSYRALVSIQNVTEFQGRVIVLHSQDFKLGLYEDFSNGEEMAEKIGMIRNRNDASMWAMDEPELRGVGFQDDAARMAWIDTHADQTWEVQYRPKDGYTRVQIIGRDAAGQMIFFRSRVFAD